MVGILVVTHGKVAEELVNAAKMIVGKMENIATISIGWNDNVAEARQKISEGIKRVDTSRGVIILTDMFGGTPTNISLPFLKNNQVEIITGINLPMLIKLSSLQKEDMELIEIARKVQERGQQSVYVASDVLSSRSQP